MLHLRCILGHASPFVAHAWLLGCCDIVLAAIVAIKRALSELPENTRHHS